VDRAQRLLAGLLAAQLLLLALFHNPFASRRAAADQPLLPGLASITPEKLEIDGGQGTSVILEREGGAWALGQPKGYPVTPGKVEKVIQDLEHLNVHRQVVSGSRYHAALKVAPDDFERRVRIWEKPSGNPRAELYVGSSPSYGLSHVRVGGNDRVYEASGVNSYDLPAEPASWVERNLVPIANQDVTRFELANRKGSFALEKQGGTWTVRSPASRSNTVLDQDKVGDLVRTLGGLALDEPVGPVDERAQGLTDPEATVLLGRAATKADSAAAQGTPVPAAAPAAVTIKIGAPVAGKPDQRYATRSGLGFAVSVGKSASDRALDAALADLVKKPAAPPAARADSLKSRRPRPATPHP